MYKKMKYRINEYKKKEYWENEQKKNKNTTIELKKIKQGVSKFISQPRFLNFKSLCNHSDLYCMDRNLNFQIFAV